MTRLSRLDEQAVAVRKTLDGEQKSIRASLFHGLEINRLIENTDAINRLQIFSEQSDFIALFSKLSPLEPQKVHNAIKSSRAAGTGQWIPEDKIFTEWRIGTRIKCVLWCHGAPGSGKSVLS